MSFGEVWDTRHGPVMVVAEHTGGSAWVLLLLASGALVSLWTAELVMRLPD